MASEDLLTRVSQLCWSTHQLEPEVIADIRPIVVPLRVLDFGLVLWYCRAYDYFGFVNLYCNQSQLETETGFLFNEIIGLNTAKCSNDPSCFWVLFDKLLKPMTRLFCFGYDVVESIIQ